MKVEGVWIILYKKMATDRWRVFAETFSQQRSAENTRDRLLDAKYHTAYINYVITDEDFR